MDSSSLYEDGGRRTSSVYSGVSATAARLNPNGNGIGSTNTNGHAVSRPTSHASSRTPYVPSYMSHVPSRSQTSSLSINVPKSPAYTQPVAVELPAEPSITTPRGQLLVLAAGALHESTLSYIEMLVSRQPLSGIILVASHEHEAALKALKMDCYALIGRLSKEMSVTTHFQDQWSQADVENTVQQITKTGEIQGVLCCPASEQSEAASGDVLSMDANQLHQAWTRSIAFVHGATEATIEYLQSRCKNDSSNLLRAVPGPFFLVAAPPAYSVASQIAKVACDTFLLKLEKAAKGINVAYAEDVLIPDPLQDEESSSNATSGPFLQPAEMYHASQPNSEYVSPESPTKLWAAFNAANIE